MILVNVYGIKCTVVSQKSAYVRSTLHYHQRGQWALFQAFMLSSVQVFIHSFMLSHAHPLTPSHTHPHTHTPFTYPHRWQQQLLLWFRPATIGWWLPCQRGACYFCSPKKASASVIWRNGPLMLRYVYNTWWCHHDVTRDNDVLVLCPRPHPQNDTSLISWTCSRFERNWIIYTFHL